MHIQDCLSTGGIAARLGETPAKIRHIVNYRQIADCGRLGGVRLFSPAAVVQIEAELKAMRPRKRRTTVPA